MKATNNVYRKNFSLITVFLILISVIFLIALVVAYNFTTKNVESEFSSKKEDVSAEIINPYNDFLNNKIPEITNFQGLLDSASAGGYAGEVFQDYTFVKRIVFFRILIGAAPGRQNPKNKLSITDTAIYLFKETRHKLKGIKTNEAIFQEDFRYMAGKFSEYIAGYDTLLVPKENELSRACSDIRPGKISFINIPRREDLKIYRGIEKRGTASSYKQNMFSFLLDPLSIPIKNVHPELYQNISIQQTFYDPLIDDPANTMVAQVALPGAFSDYKLYFTSPRDFLNPEINKRFLPVAGIVALIYVFLLLVGWLIYRNLNVNLKLFKLQYDFINNFTHEFKTPVSVIKIAGSNLKGDGELTDRQRKHYGKILDEEADKLNELMNKLLSFTQLENKSITIKKDKVNIDTFTQGYIDTFKIKYPDFKLRCRIDDVKYFYTDPVLLGSVFQNLIENAYKYSPVDNKELLVEIAQEKRNIIFTFKDKGIGIPKDELNNIFKKFYRLENQYNQNGSVGLGLAFCKELVNFMDGEITVHSKVGQGSEFKVVLPYEN